MSSRTTWRAAPSHDTNMSLSAACAPDATDSEKSAHAPPSTTFAGSRLDSEVARAIATHFAEEPSGCHENSIEDVKLREAWPDTRHKTLVVRPPYGGHSPSRNRRFASRIATPGHQPRMYAKINGATIVASDSMTYFGVATSSLPQVIFSLGIAPEYEP
jgi:hypothetical protein